MQLRKMKLIPFLLIFMMALTACHKDDVSSEPSSEKTVSDSAASSSDGNDETSIPDESYQEPSYPAFDSSALLSSLPSSLTGVPSSVSSRPNNSSQKPSVSSKKPSVPSAKPPTEYTGKITVKTPVASGKLTHQENGAVIDYSNASEGYVMAKCKGSGKRLKLRVTVDKKLYYNYDLNQEGKYEVFPLQLGNGTYEVQILENISGTKYMPLATASFAVKLKDSFSPYLYPSQYVNFNAAGKAVKKSYDLCVGAKTELDRVQAIYSFIIKNIKYDTHKAATVKSGYLPDADTTLKNKKGICFDYANLMAVMLRAQNIPTKLITGNVAPNNLSHAWNLVYTKQTGWIPVGIYFEKGKWKLMDSTFAAAGSSMDKFVGNGSNYTQLKQY